MSVLTRHQISAILLAELRQNGLGVRDLFEGRQEPLSWFFRGLAFDQSELDIMESGAIETLHAPSALVELVVDEFALACANLGTEGVAGYLTAPPPPGEEEGEPLTGADLTFDSTVMLGFLNVDVAPPALWLEERQVDRDSNERLAARLAREAQETGAGADVVEVHIEGALDAAEGWSDAAAADVRPAGVSIHFTYDIPLQGVGDRELARIFGAGARTAFLALEGMRRVFREG
jgi:hypothetical protein